jgi:3-oxoacyl-[acyl-carrier protein] reductase
MTACERFVNRTAIITGGASGIGLHIAKRLLAEGATVALWDVDATALKSAQTTLGSRCHPVHLNVAVWESVEEAARKSLAHLNKFDILIAGAGISGPNAPLAHYSIDEWKRVIETNLIGTFHSCRAVVPHMLANGYGRIVAISSIAGKEGNPNASAYSASKAGIIALTKSLGKELATTKVLVNAVAPAVFQSPLLLQMTEQHVKYMLSKIPMGRFGELDEISAMICWLASEEMSFSTGAVFDISGGRATY